jgi:hypothetical protein
MRKVMACFDTGSREGFGTAGGGGGSTTGGGAECALAVCEMKRTWMALSLCADAICCA